MGNKRPPTPEEYARQCPIPPPPPPPPSKGYKESKPNKQKKDKDDDSLWPLFWLAMIF